MNDNIFAAGFNANTMSCDEEDIDSDEDMDCESDE